MNKKNHYKDISLVRYSIIFILIFLWEVTARMELYNTFYTSYPTKIFIDLIDFYKSGDLIRHTFTTLKEAILGLIIGTIIGLTLAVLLAQIKNLGKVLVPIISAINGIPQLTLAPIYILWFGTGLKSKVFLSGLMVFFNVFFSTYNGIRNIDESLIESSNLLGASKMQTLFWVILPSSMPWILSGIRMGIGVCLIGAIIGEYIGSSQGLGWMVTYAASFFKVTRVMSCIFILLISGLVFNTIFDMVEKRVLKWQKHIKE